MAHFAKIDESNIVIDIIRISNEDLLDENGEESEDIGLNVVRSFTGYDNWIQASYNSNFRNMYPDTGCIYDPVRDVFINPKPMDDFIFDEESLEWVPPIPVPEGGDWFWNPETNSWIEEAVIEGEAGD
jgi:hypothetical protein